MIFTILVFHTFDIGVELVKHGGGSSMVAFLAHGLALSITALLSYKESCGPGVPKEPNNPFRNNGPRL